MREKSLHRLLTAPCAVLLVLAATERLNAQNYGVHFLGNTTDNVTTNAGVVPIAGWNNIAAAFTSGSISASDGSNSATLTLSGAWPGDGGWSTGINGDGANLSLMHGFWDAGNPASTGVATISGLPDGRLYNVYLYTFSDGARPQNSGDSLPNYSVNGVTDYAPVRGVQNSFYSTASVVGGSFTGFVQGTVSFSNTNVPIPAANFGNYIVVSNVSSDIGGTITVVPEADSDTARSPIAGVEIVPASGPSFGIHFLGNQQGDPVTGTAGIVPMGNWNNIDNQNFFSGSSAGITGSDGSTAATLTLSGGQVANAWNSGLTGDGGNLSLMHGFLDAGNYGGTPATIALSGLPANTSYNVYLYCISDNSKPGGGHDELPNYAVNSINYYMPVLGGNGTSQYITTGAVSGNGFNGFVAATTTNANDNHPRPAGTFGNYIVISNVVPVGSAITIGPEVDGVTFRSPLNGIELVPSSGASFGIHFLGGQQGDPVTGTAGIVPIANWNNIDNKNFVQPGTAGITGDDGVTAATLSLSGGQVNNGWQTGLTGDGANLSLMDGFMDAGTYGGSAATVAISGLTAPSYTAFIYCMSDSARPADNQDWIPNYSVNGTTYYAPVFGANNYSSYLTTAAIGGLFNGFIRATATNANSRLPVPLASFGNYVEYSQVAATGGQITVQVEPDTTTYRSPLNGIELVAVPPTLAIKSSGTNVILNWSPGILLQATNLLGPWTTNSGTSPMNISPAAASQTFYRVLVP
ncbi:MAG TPA: hypothetical protein VH597_13800 [Verrucomicrobiae bacterium]|jgi:hypothetical protein|nr:hypothetical protein [Verrucomicrobiae bacterium]